MTSHQIEDALFTNHYLCSCGHEWEDRWSAACNDKCIVCGTEIEPYSSDDGSVDPEQIEQQRQAAAGRMNVALPD